MLPTQATTPSCLGATMRVARRWRNWVYAPVSKTGGAQAPCGFKSHPPHSMRPEIDKRVVAHLAAADLGASEIAYIAGLPRSTVRDWLRAPPQPRMISVDSDSFPKAEYSYLLGFYLGDGTISRYRNGVYRLRVKTDSHIPI
jgi:hypothetical protein